jgi:hypothetical protein
MNYVMQNGPVLEQLRLKNELERRKAGPGMDSGQSVPESAVVESGNNWPKPLGDAAFHGIAGELSRLVEPNTESDIAAVLVQFLVGFGNLIGRGPHFLVEDSRHASNLFAAIVGESGKARKGTSLDRVRKLLNAVDETWNMQGGLSSGEGLTYAVRDAITKSQPIKEGGRVVDYQDVIEVRGVEDKRLLVAEAELASPIKVMARDGNTLSPVLRNAWDGIKLQSMTKNSPVQATNSHISIIGHITKDELLRHLNSTEMANGFANRFLWVCARRSKLLPNGGAHVDLEPIIRKLREILGDMRGDIEVRRNAGAQAIWEHVYSILSEGRPGLLGSVTGRAEAQTMRLAMVYALLDGKRIIATEHMYAALAVWEYAENSARYIFGDLTGYGEADIILDALKKNPLGLTRTDISSLFGRNRSEPQIQIALNHLQQKGLVRTEKENTGGRPVERWLTT